MYLPCPNPIVMKNQLVISVMESPEARARKAVQHIQKWFEENHPQATTAVKANLILECLIEVTEERKFLSMN